MNKQLGFVFAAAVLFAGAAAASAADNRDSKPVKDRSVVVMSYNVNHAVTPCDPAGFAADGTECGLDLDAIANVIRGSDADVIGVQELDRFWPRSGMVDQPEYLAKELGMFYCFAANIRNDDGSEYGTAILSRLPILECTTSPLPVSPGVEPRGLLTAWVNVQGVPLLFLNAHLGRTAEDRERQLHEIAAAIDGITQPVLLAGDLNAPPEELGQLSGFVDVWTQVGSGDGVTSFADPYELSPGRIDYVLIKGATATSADVIGTAGESPSDHYPVRAGISLTGASFGVGKRK